MPEPHLVGSHYVPGGPLAGMQQIVDGRGRGSRACSSRRLHDHVAHVRLSVPAALWMWLQVESSRKLRDSLAALFDHASMLGTTSP
jgi:hypothetical protein